MKEDLLKETQQAHNKPFSCNIVLIAFMGAGEKVRFRILSRKYNMDTVENGSDYCRKRKMSISRYLSVHGGRIFSGIWKTNLLIEMQAKTNTVISCGGGVATKRESGRNAEKLKQMRWFLLTATPETILERVKTA